MKDNGREAVIVAAARLPIGRAKKGVFVKTRPDDLFATAIKAVLKKLPAFDYKGIEDVLCGSAFPEAEEGMNVARVASILAGLPIEVPGATINRFCGSAMTALHKAAYEIMGGAGDIFIVGGTESMTMIPMTSNKPTPNIRFVQEGTTLPNVYISMGETAEKVIDRYGNKYNITRESMDKFSYNSHVKAINAQETGRFKDEMVSVTVNQETGDVDIYDGKNVPKGCFLVNKDDCPRADTTVETLAKLKPVFRINGRVTAGNSSPTNDGAAVMVLMSSSKAKELGIKPLAKIRATAVRALEPEVMGLGPIYATRRILERAKMNVKDIQLAEINEAFASQSIASIEELGFDPNIVNVNGGAIALGHPLGISGVRILTTLLYEMIKRDLNIGLGTMCIGGGQGIATILER
ncbi:MAG: thiolase family protein [Deltaproteobacteria bacterium]|nr:thiolase family protein [Deltaproteobacteria bacterium]MCL5791938.1 thiolase family protein [Deltaproteobacteria bacterium]